MSKTPPTPGLRRTLLALLALAVVAAVAAAAIVEIRDAGAPKPMDPFPNLRVQQRTERSSTVFQVVTVDAPAAARLQATCRGALCPFQRVEALAGGRRPELEKTYQ